MDRIKIKKKEILYNSGWSSLSRYQFDYEIERGKWQSQAREVYDRGDGATVLLHNPQTKKIILIKQLRLPTFLNGHPSGHLIETCAGMIEEEKPEEAMMREIEEETGYRLDSVEKIFEAYMSPGSVTEKIHFFIGQYQDAQKVSAGGGIKGEEENIEVLEMDFELAWGKFLSGEIKDGKTIMLLQYHRLRNYGP